ncbi:unnamed protein product [Adineta steineri]|uniref:DUF4201 domain-containing protein n=1 Tax=Adineta steineri TaxID=433720 RepID=A0A814YTV9_9BILA|nr:unnamed protein product [Adineta steineri]CAF3480433.1 unnamed protein product [Adineta steineri]
MTDRLINRIRHSDPDIEFLPIESIGRARRGLSLGSSSLMSNNETINRFASIQLLAAIHKAEKINKYTRLENELFYHYLRRIESSKIIEKFDDYEDEDDMDITDRYNSSDQSSVYAKLPEVARRSSLKRNSLPSSNALPSWSKLVTNWRSYMFEAYLLRVEQEKLSIAAYEIEQTKLDLERMNMNARLVLDHFYVLLRTAESDETAHKTFYDDLRKNINKFRQKISGEKMNKSRVRIPAELLINHFNKRLHSRMSLIGNLHTNTARTQLRIRIVDAAIYALDHSHEKMREIDINFVRTRKVDYLNTYEKLDRQYKIEKSAQYPVLNQLQEMKTELFQQEKEKFDMENKYKLLENRLEKLTNEINSIEHENEIIFNENNIFKNRLADIKQAPSIINYAYSIEQSKQLQYEIGSWIRKVNIAQVSFHIYELNFLFLL